MSLAHILHAASFAATKHQSQRRKDRAASPYINHPLAVAEVFRRHGVTDSVVIQAATVVMEVTDDKSLPKEERKRLQIEHAAGSSKAAKLVKVADKICNARDVSENLPAGWGIDRRRECLEWTRQVVDHFRVVNPGLEKHFDELLREVLRPPATEGRAPTE